MKVFRATEGAAQERLKGTEPTMSDPVELPLCEAAEAEAGRLEYQALFESMPLPCLVSDARSMIRQVNQAATTLFGTNIRSLIGTPLSDWISSEDRESFAHWLKQLRRSEPPDRMNLLMRSRQNEAFVAELLASPVRDGACRLALCWIIRCVPQEECQHPGGTVTPFPGLVDSLPVGILHLNAQRRCLYANAGWQELSGLTGEESQGYGWSRVLHPDDRQMLLRGWPQEAQDGHMVTCENRLVTTRAEVVSVLTRVRRMESSEGRLTGYVVTVGDVTEQRREVEELRASERRFRALTERSWDGISLIAADGTILYDNPAASTRILGYATGELVGLSAFSRLHPDDRRRIIALFGELIEQPGSSATADFRYAHKDGSWRWIECAGTNLLHEPSIQAIVCNYRDITERRHDEEEIRQRNRELAALNTITAAVSSSLELPEVLATFKRLVTEELSIPAGMIFFSDPHDGQLRLQDSWGLPPSMPNELTSFPLTGPEYDQVMHQKKGVLVPDFREMAPFYRLNLDVAHPEWESYVCVPLLANDSIHGAIGLFGHAPSAFREDQIGVFEALGQEVGVAIQNARLFEQVRDWQERLETLSRRLVDLQEKERQHIARELHDDLGQLLTGLKLSLEMTIRKPEGNGHQQLSDVLEQVNELISHVRELSLDLRPAMLDDLGLLPTLLWHFDRYTAQTGVRVAFEHTGLERRLPAAVETAAYRIVQESLTNVARHAGVSKVLVTVWAQGKHLSVEVYDQGRGFDTRGVWRGGGTFGLVGMRERAVLLGGQLAVCSVPGRGTQLSAILPIARESAADGEADGV